MYAAELPPRRQRKIAEVTIQRNKSSLEVLMQMGFSKLRADKALAATGDKGVQIASDWLLSHVNDPLLDENMPRDYILYLCPVGQMQQVLVDFWQKSYQECGWNRAHNYFPHITLCAFFKADDSQVSKLSHALKTVGERWQSRMPETMDLEYFSSTNFIGLFVVNRCEALIRQITADCCEEAKKAGIVIGAAKREMHLSLAYHFPVDVKDKLETYAKALDPRTPVRWDLRLYSRDSRIGKCQVMKVMLVYTPRAPDELELVNGDFVFVDESELENSPDGWYQGTSWLTGCSGLLPGSYVERAAETETWTMHRSIPIIGTDLTGKTEQNGLALDNMTYQQQCELDPKRSSLVKSHSGSSKATSVPGGQSTVMEGSNRAVKGPSNASVGSRSLGQQQTSGSRPTGSPASSVEPMSLTPIRPSATTLSVGGTSQSSSLSSLNETDSSLALNKLYLSQGTQSTLPQRDKKPTIHQSTQSTLSLQERAKANSANAQSDNLQSPKVTRRLIPAENATPFSHVGSRQLYIVRHGERIDFTFGKDWISHSFDHAGNYIRYDLNMPKSLPKRKGGPSDFTRDSPMTVQGHFQAKLLGEAMKEKDIAIGHVYCSPSLRCIETASCLLEGLGLKRDINVEPGLFEWLGWYKDGLPRFMTVQELRDCGFSVNTAYNVVMPSSKYNLQETMEQHYERSHFIATEILRRHESEGGNILIVAHAASLDVCVRQLVGLAPRSQAGFLELLHKIPYCAMSVVQEACHVRDTWYLIEPPVLPFAHTNNAKYNWTAIASST